jgi:hypothetical protein
LTIDTCVDAGECNASCSNKPCPIACSSDSDCDDSELATRDFCSNAGTCLAKCSHEEQRAFVFEFASDFNSIGRGSLVDLNVLVKDLNGNAVEGASIYAVDSAGRRIDLNGVGLGRYFAVYEVPAGFAIGVQKLSFLASKGGFVGVEEIVLNVLKGNIDAILLEPAEPRVIAGQNIELRFRLAYGDGSPVADGNAGALMNDVSIELALDSNGFFTGSYLFSEADLNGAVLVISSSDSLGNEGLTEIAFSVQNPIPLVSIAVGILIAIALLVAAYVFRRTRRLSGILHRVRRLEKESKGTRLKHAIEKEKGAREKLAKRIEKQEKELVLLRQEAEAERKKQTLAVQRIPIESRYAVHEAAFGFRAGIGKLFSRAPKKSAERLKAEKRLLEIDSEIEALDAKVKALEESYVKKGLKEEDFKKKLFDLREKSHLLELEKKKIE